MLDIEVPVNIHAFALDLCKSSLFMDGSYLLEEDADPDILFSGSELTYRGDVIEGDPLFNTFSLKIELNQGGSDPCFIRKLLSLGADATGTRQGLSLDAYAEMKGDIEVAKIIREHLAQKGH